MNEARQDSGQAMAHRGAETMDSFTYTHHVVPNPNGGWDVKRGVLDRTVIHADTKQEAIDAARQLSRSQGTELKIHNLDGRIAQSDSHGNDPRRIEG